MPNGTALVRVFAVAMGGAPGLLQNHQYGPATMNILASNLAGVGFALVGFWIAELVARRIR